MIRRLFWTAYLARHALGQATYPFKPLARVRRDQRRRVRRIVAHAYRHVPYYRETMDRLGFTPADFRTADDLAKLPLLERHQIVRDPEYFVSTAQPLDHYLRVCTGGSTGEPCPVYHDTRAVLLSAAHSERGRSVVAPVIGRRYRYREAAIVVSNTTTSAVRDFCVEHTCPPRGVPSYRRAFAQLDPLDRTLSLLNDFKPDVIYSYGSYLTMLFVHVHESGAALHRPKAVIYGSDEIPESVKRLIREQFGVAVFSWYGAAEAFKIGFECEHHRGLHLNLDLYPVRIIDEQARPVPQGEVGQLVVSNLTNRGTVLLNYRLGDIAALLPDPCPCGRTLPLLSFPEGRRDDLIVLPSGRLMHPVAVRCVFLEEPLVWEHQVVQRTPTHFDIAAVPAASADRPALARRLADRFASTFGQEVTVDVSFVDSIDRTRAGKHRPVLSLLQQARLHLPS